MAILLANLAFASCRAKPEDVVRVENKAPKISDPKFVELKKLYSLDVSEINLFNKENYFEPFIDFDADNRMSVFNDRGTLVKKFGRSGQGPSEFSRVNRIRIHGDKIYVFQEFTVYKIIDLDGGYLFKNMIFFENRFGIRSFGEGFYVLRGKIDPTFTKLELILTLSDDRFTASRDVFHYQYPPGLGGPTYEFRLWDWVLITDDGGFYFPEDNLGKYSLARYDREGRAKTFFGRPYEILPYSKEARDRFFSLPGHNQSDPNIKFPATPPVIVKMFQDQKGNLWTISGETYEDNLNPDFENTIDIFSPKGEWLYSMKSKSVSKNVLYNNGRIYKVRPFIQDSTQQMIDVFQISYVK
jgi:hypothetical protein